MECKYCQSSHMKIEQGKPPHVAMLICGTCDRFQKWVSKAQLPEVKRQILEQNMREDREENRQLFIW